MVNSILNANINYPELKKLDTDDKNYDATMYEISIMNVDIIIALGQPKYTFIDDNIIYYPIYLVKDDKVNTQIGVYEILANQLPNLVDDDGDIELDKINLPLTYQFVTIELLKSAENKLAISHDKQHEDTSDDKLDEELDEDLNKELDSDDVNPSDQPSDRFETDEPLPEQTEAQSDKESNEYVHDKSAPWIQHYLNSNEYNIIDNEGGGDCLFAVIRDALKSVDKDMSVMDLRKKLSSEVTNEIFENYKNQYTMYANTARDTDIELKDLSRSINELKDRLRNSKDRSEQEKIVEHAKETATKYKTLKAENNITKELMGEFRFMKKVKSLDDFKKIITTCEFWADTWAISTLERILNIKLVIFSSESWNQGDKSNVIQCGQLNDQVDSDAKFEPQYYILLDYTGTHYKLITYKYHRIFNFVEIPYRIKLLITNKCLEKLAGPYNLIPQFRVFNEQLGIEQPVELDIEVINEKENGLYTDDIVFQYYIKSNNKPLPGKGIGEKIPADMVKTFSALSQIPEWRRKLDNEYESPFELDGHKWKTVEHYYQAAKFKNTNKEFYLLFSLDSGSKISTDVELANSAGSKTGKHKGDLLRSKDIKIDPDFFGGNDDLALEKALFAKFSQNNEMKQLLINTQNAKLLHYRKGAEADISNLLMMVRNKISQ